NENDVFQQACDAYNQGSALEPYNPHYDLAFALLNQLIEHNPQFARAYNLRAHIRYLRRDDLGAIEDANDAIDRAPHVGAYYYNRGSYREYLKDFAGALGDFRHARELGIEQGDDDLVEAADHHIPDLERWLANSE